MGHYVTRRLLAAVPQGLLVLIVMFVLVRLTPGDPVTAYLSRIRSEASVPDAYLAQVRHDLGLDRPMPMQFGLYVRRVAAGDLGISYTHSEPVLTVILAQLPHTVHLALAALLVELLLGLPLGFIHTPAGRQVPSGALQRRMHRYADLVWEYQFRQERPEALDVWVVPQESMGPTHREVLGADIKSLLGSSIAVRVVPVAAIPREASEKQPVIKRLLTMVDSP